MTKISVLEVSCSCIMVCFCS
uniref:Uncharacterized protein n=1 Tax=Rhizophora mucronata TaxID=61149 RepID=A0A2P2PVA3_RHIMU